MKAVVACITAALLAGHAIFGCGWHRPHAFGDQPVACAAACNHDHEGPCPEDHGDQPCKCGFLCRSTCNYLPPSKVQFDTQLSSPLFFFLAPLATPADAPHRWHASRCVDPDMIGPPLRLHLVHQVLLI